MVKIHTKLVIDIETGAVLEDVYCSYAGPLALCDRAAQASAKDASKTAGGAAATYGAEAGGLQTTLVPTLERDITNAPGFDPIGLGDMKTEAEATSAGALGASREGSRLRAIRTGNPAATGSEEVAMAGETARAGGSALQRILAKNAELKATQREGAIKGMEGLIGEDIKGQAEQADVQQTAIKNQIEAGKTGWLQNALAIAKTGADLTNAYSGLVDAYRR